MNTEVDVKKEAVVLQTESYVPYSNIKMTSGTGHASKVKILNEKAVVPTRAHETDTGYDLTFIGVSKVVSDTIYFTTGIALSPPTGYYFEIVPRSSISGLPLMMANSVGIVDEHYTGEIIIPVKVLHPNLGKGQERNSFPGGIVNIFGARPSSMADLANQILQNKPKLFQLILRERLDTGFTVVESLENTERGAGGFGSTDVKEVSTKTNKKKP